MAVFCWCCDFLANSVCARDLSLLNSVKYDSSLISFSAPLQVNSFLISANYLFYAVTVFFFFFGYAVTVSNFSELFSYAATVFFLPELILRKYSVEG